MQQEADSSPDNFFPPRGAILKYFQTLLINM